MKWKTCAEAGITGSGLQGHCNCTSLVLVMAHLPSLHLYLRVQNCLFDTMKQKAWYRFKGINGKKHCFINNLVVGKDQLLPQKAIVFYVTILNTGKNPKFCVAIDCPHPWLISNNLLILSVARLGGKIPQGDLSWYFWVNICNDHDSFLALSCYFTEASKAIVISYWHRATEWLINLYPSCV